MSTAPGHATTPATGGRWRVLWRIAGAVFLLALVAALVLTLRRQDWTVVGTLLARRGGPEVTLLLLASLAVNVLGLGFGFLAWRVILLELGPPVAAASVLRIFVVGFLSKYVPGKVPGMAATARVAHTAGVGLVRLAGAGALSMSLGLLTALTIGLFAGAEVLGDRAGWLLLAPAVLLAVLVWPQAVNRVAHWMLRLMRREPAGRMAAPRPIRLTVAWQSVSWVITGLHLWVLAVAMGAPPLRSLALTVGAFSLATAVGLVAVFTPDGIGVREAVLTAALAVVLPVPAAAVVALASRLVCTVAEIGMGSVALVAVEIARRRSRAATGAAVTKASTTTGDERYV